MLIQGCNLGSGGEPKGVKDTAEGEELIAGIEGLRLPDPAAGLLPFTFAATCPRLRPNFPGESKEKSSSMANGSSCDSRTGRNDGLSAGDNRGERRGCNEGDGPGESIEGDGRGELLPI